MRIQINGTTCTSCTKCVKVCPSLILQQDASSGKASVHNPHTCIACGHCVAVCASDSIEHERYPKSTIHPVDYNQYPTPEQLMLLIRSRRSNRAFTQKPIPQSSLDWIAEAGLRAPTASNSTNVRLIVITDLAKLKQISEWTIGVFDGLAHKLTNPFLKPILKCVIPDVYKYEKVFSNMKSEYAKGNDLILRRATAVILFYAPFGSRFAVEDTNLSYQNASLMAESLGVSQFYTGFVLTAIKQKGSKELQQLLGINGKICAGMALGMPQFRYPNYIDRMDYLM